MNLTQKQIDLFWSRVDVRGPDECWNWKAGKDKDGYGIYRNVRAHRLAFLLEHGRLPRPLGLHSCDNPSCANPNHIHEGTHKDNVDEMILRGRAVRGEKHHSSKLDAAKVADIRRSKASDRNLAKRYGVTKTAIWLIKHNLTWKTN